MLPLGWTDSEGEDATQREFHGAGEDWRAKAAASTPMGKLGQVDEIADSIVSSCRTAAASSPVRSSTGTRPSSAARIDHPPTPSELP